ncbi:twin transmembrane helix small protein [Rhodoferax bucti]|uniref:twin transmembrane helix small protein n=1 Tax=Rhodoferax bucti TaxID=2576305 RepID=UPI0011080146|nr:twin transmembrane helix small protein [Rhodoferax bucti]
MTYLVILAFATILGSLAAALYFMLKGGATQGNKSRNMARALGMRVGISVLLFLCLMLAWKLGYIHPTGIAAGR